MGKSLEEIAEAMGARIKAILPDVGGGALAAEHQGKFYQQQMQSRVQETNKQNASGTTTPIILHLPLPILNVLDDLVEWLHVTDATMDRQQLAMLLLGSATLRLYTDRFAEIVSKDPRRGEHSAEHIQRLDAMKDLLQRIWNKPDKSSTIPVAG